MRQIRPFSDTRLDQQCTYCGENVPDTRDHVPSKILLDDPFPENLPVVPSCSECNSGFSLDEEYFACLLECILCGTTDVDKLKREKIKKILSNKERLRKKLEQDKIEQDGVLHFKVDWERLNKVFMKLAKGHAKYEYSVVQHDEPEFFLAKPLYLMSDEEKDEFFKIDIITKIPEVGSRGNYIFISDGIPYAQWVDVQENNYCYLTQGNSGTIVKIVIWDYFAVEVRWE